MRLIDVRTWIVPVTLLAFWEMAVRLEMIDLSQAAAPTAVLWRLLVLGADGELIRQAAYSVARLITGTITGALSAIAVGAWLVISHEADRVLSPTLRLLSGMPVIIWIPVWIMMLGTAEGFKIGMVAITVFFLVESSASEAMWSVGRPYAEVAAICGRSRWQMVREVLLPCSARGILWGVRLGLIFSWVVLVFVEYAVAQQGREGLGWFINDRRTTGKIEDEFAGILLLGVLAYLLDRLVELIQRRVLDWANTLDTVDGHGQRFAH
jgi:sulfonate transport system permease protein